MTVNFKAFHEAKSLSSGATVLLLLAVFIHIQSYSHGSFLNLAASCSSIITIFLRYKCLFCNKHTLILEEPPGRRAPERQGRGEPDHRIAGFMLQAD